MKIVTVAQNTKLWHDWRGKGIGASEAPAILGDSPWTTPFQVWLEKTGLGKREEPNAFAAAAMAHGHATEPEARAAYEALTGLRMEVLAAEHDACSFIRASFDGINQKIRRILEIKCTGKSTYDKVVKSGKIPQNYYAQVQQQLLVSGYEYCDFFVYYTNSKGDAAKHILIEVKADKKYQIELFMKLKEFWQQVETKTCPPISQMDFQSYCKQVQDQATKLSTMTEVLQLMLGGLQ